MDYLFAAGQSGLYVYFFYKFTQVLAKLQRVEFDEEFLYVIRKNQDIIIPLENIESVEIVSLGGVYKINLYHAEQLGTEFYFKPSLIYPLNYKSKDALVNLLRKQIRIAKSHKQSITSNALTS